MTAAEDSLMPPCGVCLFKHKRRLESSTNKRKEKQTLWQTLMGLSISPPHRDCRGIRKGLQVGFKLFFTT